MSVTIIVGAQWGDEGKGKLTHLLTPAFDTIIRYQGGSNAGHTVRTEGRRFKFNLLPSGILYPDKTCILCDGVVVDPARISAEIADLKALGLWHDNLLISSNAHVVLSYHKVLDKLEEERLGNRAIGTTCHGIGPAYADKYCRVGIRAGDLLDKGALRRKVEYNAETKNVLLRGLYHTDPMDAAKIYDELVAAAEPILPYIANTLPIIRDKLAAGKSILLEGAQGTLLDVDYGTYPFVTSSHPVSAGACLGTGIAPAKIDRIIGVTKAYATRVGNGSFPTEQVNSTGDRMREGGREYGTTTGRPRRCGWLDLVLLKYAIFINGVSELAMTKIDVLDAFETIKVCVGYKYKGDLISDVDLDDKILLQCEPAYKDMPGWKRSVGDVRDRKNLPKELMALIAFVEDETRVPVSIASVGPDRDQTVMLA
jgi:adenylosuccinate synthase